MNGFESIFLNLGCTWVISKLLPFFFVTVFGACCWFFVRKKIPLLRLKMVFLVASIAIPFFAYFLFSPIYEDDFNGKYLLQPIPKELKEMKVNELTILALPECPFCFQSMEIANTLVGRNPQLKITYVVLSHEPNGAEKLRALANPQIKFKLGIHLSELETTAAGQFPAFLMRKGNRLAVWDFNQIGPYSLDQIEHEFIKKSSE